MKLMLGIDSAVLRRRARMHQTPVGQFTVRIARTTQEFTAAFRLVHAAYAAQGITGVRGPGIRIAPQHLLRDTHVLVAYRGDSLVGTMTVFLDSQAGLPLDRDYAKQLDKQRSNGARLAEIGSLAVVQSAQGSGVTNLMNIAAFRLAYVRLGASHIVIGIHPRAKLLHQAVYGFRSFGNDKKHDCLAAPVTGLVQERYELERHFATHFKRALASGRTALEHIIVTPPECIDLGEELPVDGDGCWQMPRHVFRGVFLKSGACLDSVDNRTRDCVMQQRSRNTLQGMDMFLPRRAPAHRQSVVS